MNRICRTFALIAAVFALASPLTVLSVRAGHDESRVGALTEVNVLPPVGLTFGQTLRVTLLNAGGSPFEIVPCFFDGEGAHLKTGDSVMLAPGQMRSLDLRRTEIGTRTEPSVQVRAGVHGDASDLKYLMTSGELIEDATGRSSLYVPGKGSAPAFERDGRATISLAPVGLGVGQTIRITFFNAGDRPLEIIPCFFDGEGRHLKEGERLTIAPGHMFSFEMSRSEVAASDGGRVDVRGATHVGTADAKDLLLVGEVVEEVSGKSAFYVPSQLVVR